MRYFLEVFNPNVETGFASLKEAGAYVGDSIIRCFAGLTRAERPRFLKIAYNGPRAMTELCSYDPELVVGILGGAAGTNRDTFQLLADAQRDGAEWPCSGARSSSAESPLEMVRHMRRVVDGELSPEEAVREYHAGHPGGRPRPARPLDEDLRIHRAGLAAGALNRRGGKREREASRMAEQRSGILTFGSFITDHNLAIESYPPEDQATFITSRQRSAGGPGYNIAANLRRLDPAMRVECHGSSATTRTAGSCSTHSPGTGSPRTG